MWPDLFRQWGCTIHGPFIEDIVMWATWMPIENRTCCCSTTWLATCLSVCTVTDSDTLHWYVSAGRFSLKGKLWIAYPNVLRFLLDRCWLDTANPIHFKVSSTSGSLLFDALHRNTRGTARCQTNFTARNCLIRTSDRLLQGWRSLDGHGVWHACQCPRSLGAETKRK